MIVAFPQLFAWVLITYDVPGIVTNYIGLNQEPYFNPINSECINVCMMGCFMDPISNMVILLPLVMTTIKTVGINAAFWRSDDL